MEHAYVRNQIYQYIYNDKYLNVRKKIIAMNNLQIGIYKKQIMNFISLHSNINDIINAFVKEVVDKI